MGNVLDQLIEVQYMEPYNITSYGYCIFMASMPALQLQLTYVQMNSIDFTSCYGI